MEALALPFLAFVLVVSWVLVNRANTKSYREEDEKAAPRPDQGRRRAPHRRGPGAPQ